MSIIHREVHPDCEPVRFSLWQWVRYVIIPFAIAYLFLSILIHELAHGLANYALGGTAGFTMQRTVEFSLFGHSVNPCVGGYCLRGIYAGFKPIASVVWVESASILPAPWNRVVVLLVGPFSVILLFWLIAHLYNPVDLPCGRNVNWKWRRGWVWGFGLVAISQSIYLITDPFPGRMVGDGIALHRIFDAHGYAIGWMNPQYLIGIIAILGTTYYSLLTLGINLRPTIKRVIPL